MKLGTDIAIFVRSFDRRSLTKGLIKARVGCIETSKSGSLWRFLPRRPNGRTMRAKTTIAADGLLHDPPLNRVLSVGIAVARSDMHCPCYEFELAGGMIDRNLFGLVITVTVLPLRLRIAGFELESVVLSSSLLLFLVSLTFSGIATSF